MHRSFPQTSSPGIHFSEARTGAAGLIEPALEAAETGLRAVEAQIADPGIAPDHKKLDDLCRQLGQAQAKIASLYARWTELEAN